MSEIELRIYNPANPDEHFTIILSNTSIFIARQDGEGMGIGQKKLYDIIDNYFKECH